MEGMKRNDVSRRCTNKLRHEKTQEDRHYNPKALRTLLFSPEQAKSNYHTLVLTELSSLYPLLAFVVSSLGGHIGVVLSAWPGFMMPSPTNPGSIVSSMPAFACCGTA